MSSRNTELCITIILDAFVFACAIWIAQLTRYGTLVPSDPAIWLIATAPVVGVLCLTPFGFYRELIRYLGPQMAYRAAMGVSLTTLVLLSISFLAKSDQHISRLSFLTFWMAGLLGIIGVRLFGRTLLRAIKGNPVQVKRRVLIYGAGEAGAGLVSMLGQDPTMMISCFVDDNQALSGREIRGVRVYSADLIEKLIDTRQISTIMLALPSASREKRRKVIERLSPFPVDVLTVPDLSALKAGANVSDLRPIDIADLLGREMIQPQQNLLQACIKSRTILVTGAGGSIGTELCRQIIELAPARLILLDNCEFNLYQIEQELLKLNRHGTAIVPILGDVCDALRLKQLMVNHGVETVYHVAAYKHVPIVETNAIAGVRNNVLGTLCTAEAAIHARVKNFVLISTDKAVRPTSVMGASKRLAEIILQALNSSELNIAPTNFCMVRFGNVLGSSGSAVPKFIEQIKQGGPITVTHEEVTRYFMTVHEAANLVIQAGSLAKGGEVFVLDMGESVKIADLATRLVELSGSTIRNEKNPNGEIEIKYTGLRSGEKLYEELLIEGDLEGTLHPKILKSAESYLPWDHVQILMHRLEAALDRRDHATVLQILQETVSGYRGELDTSIKAV